MNIVQRIAIVPSLPEKLERLKEIANNMWWCWDANAIDLFRRLSPDLWESTYHNPVKILGEIPQERLDELAGDDGFLAQLDLTWVQFQSYMHQPRKFESQLPEGTHIAYFSAEFGIDECIPNYSGGLGVLSGDHIKSASDLGLPLVGVGLLYRDGYFQQYLNADGWQQEVYPANDFYNMSVSLCRDEQGQPITFEVAYPGRSVGVRIWQILVGRVTLYLLDTNLEENSAEDREITGQLYGGDLDMRVRQEILLGIGGIQALECLGIEPAVCHMNEGHSAFLALERARRIMVKKGCTFAEAREAVAAGNCFTTHTPVPAGNDVFPPGLVDRYFADYYPQLHLSRDEFLGLGRQNPADPQEHFCMTVLALKLAAYRNGVSKLHGEVSRDMWRNVWPTVILDEVPVTSITNGIHTATWLSNDMRSLLDRYLGPRWIMEIPETDAVSRLDEIPDAELWRTHERRRERLVAFARSRLRAQLDRRGAPQSEILAADEALDPEALTIGFARRFATYKRGTLLFRNLDRLISIANAEGHKMQIIFAGKAHPHDTEGKELIRQICHHIRRPELRSAIVFIENYDMCVARYMVQGVDVWLNTPRRPLEASGTSGMKAAANGGPNMSILDGWWDEAYAKDNGWAIGHGEQYDSLEAQDQVESEAIYNLLEKEVVPMFYDRGRDGLPREWIATMKRCMKTNLPVFSTSRMVSDYAQRFYLPAFEGYQNMTADDLRNARDLAKWKSLLAANWDKVQILSFQCGQNGEVRVGEEVEMRAEVNLGKIAPPDVSVEVCYGPLDREGELARQKVVALECWQSRADSTYIFGNTLKFQTSGQQGLALRILPKHKNLACPLDAGLILWAK